ncbi:hypothetical protein Poli38472_007574 [Pythium oligandrum]|uniref:Uncharacterized protein n=1 Tax=Pythium oligandrum TaxID=41045 RepID=A0A8K1CSF4_PYTOL|nr:hypothetical protein Poli38472_007574 [Pythium oligandrum]|eukprot:TMW67902.1 hypothetical protein Poli38472_007574 [Pythium oligandrum]
MPTIDRMTMSSDSDSDTLAAVLAYIEDFPDSSEVAGPSSSDDTTVTSSRSSTDNGQASNETLTRPRPTRRVSRKDATHNRARYLQRMELVTLRLEEVALRERLERLLLTRRKRASSIEGENARTESMRHGMLTAWKDVTKRQLQRRKASEDENARLKASVLDQRHVISTLKRIIEQQIRRSNHPLVPSRLSSPDWRAVCGDGDPTRRLRIFNELVMDLQQVYSTTDLWVEKNMSRPLVDGQLIESRVIPLSSTRLLIEMVNVRLLPFHFEAFGGAYWNWVIGSQCAVFDFFREEKQVDGRATVFSGKAFSNDPSASHTANLRLRTHIAMQKYADNDQIIFAAASRSESVQVDLEDVPGVQLTERFWNVFRPPEPTTRDACLLLSFGQVELDMESGIHHTARVMNALTEYFQNRMHEHVEHHVSAIEDLFLNPSAQY